MGNQQQPWMFVEDRFGRRLRVERESRAMTQADVAGILASEHGLKLHPTAIAKMEQRDVEKPRAIRLFEAQAIADMFGITIDEMVSSPESEIDVLSREFAQLGAQADALRAQGDALFARMRELAPLMAVPADEVTPELQLARTRIIRAMASMHEEETARIAKAGSLLDEVTKDHGKPNAGTVGYQLQCARLRLGMSVEDVCAATRMKPHTVEDIEVNRFDYVAPGENHDVYVRGYIRSMADVLGMDPEPLLDQYATEYGNAAPE